MSSPICYWLYVIIVLLSLLTPQAYAIEYRFESNDMVYDKDDNEVGPRISLSGTVLMSVETLHFACRENTNAERNQLVKIVSASEVKSAAENVESNTCPSYGFTCTVVTGSLEWERDKAGKYACRAFLDQPYFIYWMDSELKVSDNIHVALPPSDDAVIRLYCTVNIEPFGSAYGDPVTIIWYRNDYAMTRNWKPVTTGNNHFAVDSSISKPNVTLGISGAEFNPILHAGLYRCEVREKKSNKEILTKQVEVTSDTKLTFGNNLRDKFIFGYAESVDISCLCQRLPFPSSMVLQLRRDYQYIESFIQIEATSTGITSMETDITSIDANYHYVEISIFNISAFIQGSSTLKCIIDDGSDTRQEITQLLEVSAESFLPNLAIRDGATFSLLMTGLNMYHFL